MVGWKSTGNHFIYHSALDYFFRSLAVGKLYLLFEHINIWIELLTSRNRLVIFSRINVFSIEYVSTCDYISYVSFVLSLRPK